MTRIFNALLMVFTLSCGFTVSVSAGWFQKQTLTVNATYQVNTCITHLKKEANLNETTVRFKGVKHREQLAIEVHDAQGGGSHFVKSVAAVGKVPFAATSSLGDTSDPDTLVGGYYYVDVVNDNGSIFLNFDIQAVVPDIKKEMEKNSFVVKFLMNIPGFKKISVDSGEIILEYQFSLPVEFEHGNWEQFIAGHDVSFKLTNEGMDVAKAQRKRDLERDIFLFTRKFSPRRDVVKFSRFDSNMNYSIRTQNGGELVIDRGPIDATANIELHLGPIFAKSMDTAGLLLVPKIHRLITEEAAKTLK
ncbi:MAG: hypothetical protein AB7F43_08725 [Bacteriovoracia bacterium]